MHDYNARKANIEAAEKAFWNEELALHQLDAVRTRSGRLPVRGASSRPELLGRLVLTRLPSTTTPPPPHPHPSQAVAEKAVLRQRTLDWKLRTDPVAHGKEMEKMLYPFAAKMQ